MRGVLMIKEHEDRMLLERGGGFIRKMEGTGKESVPGSAAGLWRNLRKAVIWMMNSCWNGLILPSVIWDRGFIFP